MYGKIFDSMYEGTLYGHWEAIVTLQQMLVLCNSEGVLDMTPQAIAARTSIPLEIIIKGIGILSEPDPYSRTPGEEGRRIALIDAHRPWGWYIVNHAKYRNLQDADTVREQTRERVRRHRELKRSVTDGNAQKRHTDAYTDAYKEKADAPDGALEPVWGSGLKTLQAAGISEQQARGFIGLMLASWEPVHVLAALQAAAGKVDPRGYVRAVLKDKPSKTHGQDPMRCTKCGATNISAVTQTSEGRLCNKCLNEHYAA